MNTHAVETALIDFLQRTSVIEALSAQYWIFEKQHGVPPVLIQVNRLVQPAYWKELSELTGNSIDEIASSAGFSIERARVQFTSLPPGVYVVCIAPRKEHMIL